LNDEQHGKIITPPATMAGKYPAPGTPFAVSPGSFHPDTIKPAEKSLTFVGYPKFFRVSLR